MNDLRLSAFAPRRRFSYAVSFDGYLFVAKYAILSIVNRRIVGQSVGRSQKRRWENPSAVTVILTHIENAKWVSRTNHRTINTEKPPFLAVFLIFWSEMGDSNSRHPAPKAGALPTALIPVIYFSGCFVGAAKSSAVPAPLHLDIQF